MRRSTGGAGILLPLLLLLPACSAQPEAPGAITADEQRQLNDAAEMLDANSVSIEALETNETTP